MARSKLVDAVWPTPEPEEALNPETLFASYHQGLQKIAGATSVAVTERLLEFAGYIFKEEDQRRGKIESKATTCIGATGILSALTIGLGSLVMENKLKGRNLAVSISLALFLVALLYLGRATILALKVFGRISRHTVGPDDLVPSDGETEGQYAKRLSERLLAYTIENYKINNRQLGVVWAAQTCLRNGILVLVAAGFLLGIRQFLRSLLAP